MTRDYAPRQRRGASRARPQSRKAAPRRRPAAQRTAFNAPSFSAGVLFGAALVLLVSYAPDVLDETVVTIREEVSEPPAEIDFEFPEMLANDTVSADPDAYPATFPDEDPSATPSEYLIQAASLKSSSAASHLSQELVGLGLHARYERVDVNSQIWYRVLVGPFQSRLEADRAMTTLRKRNLGPRLIRLG